MNIRRRELFNIQNMFVFERVWSIQSGHLFKKQYFLVDDIGDAAPANRSHSIKREQRFADIPRPVYDKRFAEDVPLVDESPETAVMAVVPVVSHDKHLSFGDGNGRKVVSRITSYDGGGGKMGMWVFYGIVVDKNLLVPYFKGIAGNADNPLYIVDGSVLGKFEYDDVAMPRFLHWNKSISAEGHFYSVYKFADQKVVAYLQSRQH